MGCFIGNKFYGALGYADDVVLLSPSLTSLQKMLHVCQAYSQEYDVLFNATKTECMCVGRSSNANLKTMVLNNTKIKWKQSVKYLGTWVNIKWHDDEDIKVKNGEFCGHVNSLLGNFWNVPVDIINSLFSTYCCCYYGSSSWNLANACTSLNGTYNNALRRIWKLPYNSHRNVTLCVGGKPPLNRVLEKRFVKLYLSMYFSNDSFVSFIARKATVDCLGTLGMNIRHICKQYNMDVQQLAECKPVLICNDIDSETEFTAEVIRELARCHDGQCDIELDNDEIRELIALLSTS